MTVERKQVGDAERYKGQRISAHYIGPDLIARVNGVELANFYTNVEAAIAAGRRYVDDQENEKAKREARETNKRSAQQ